MQSSADKESNTDNSPQTQLPQKQVPPSEILPSDKLQLKRKQSIIGLDFSSSYADHDIAQQKHVRKFIPKLLDLIVEHYRRVQRPIAIVDLCCGYGLHSHFLHQHLPKCGVEVSRIVGVDISRGLLEQGVRKYAGDAKLSFKLANVEENFNIAEQFDVAFCIFGLNWMEKLPVAVDAIMRSLLPDGLFMAINYMESRSWFKARKEFTQTSQWKQEFVGFELLPFLFDHTDYLTVFEQSTRRLHYDQEEEGFDYPRAGIVKMCQSYMQEVRHLIEDEPNAAVKAKLSQAYVEAFLNSLPEDLGGYMTKKDHDNWYFSPFIHFYAGKKL